MDWRRIGLTLGIGLTVFFAVAAGITAAMPTEFSAIVGVPAGVLSGGAAMAAMIGWWPSLGRLGRSIAMGLACFGYVVLGGFALRYPGALGLRSVLDVQSIIFFGLVGAGMAGGFYWGQAASGD